MKAMTIKFEEVQAGDVLAKTGLRVEMRIIRYGQARPVILRLENGDTLAGDYARTIKVLREEVAV